MFLNIFYNLIFNSVMNVLLSAHNHLLKALRIQKKIRVKSSTSEHRYFNRRMKSKSITLCVVRKLMF